MTVENWVWIWSLLGIVTFILLFFVSAPYGRYRRRGWGLEMDNRIGWVLMEAVSPIALSLSFWTYLDWVNIPGLILYSLWISHYVYRSLVFPFLTRTKRKKIPLSIVLMAVFFNSVNGGLNGYFLSSTDHEPSINLVFITGLILFALGFYIHFRSDSLLIRLRKENEGYSLPRGFLFNKVSCPNYLGEIIEWTGFAIMAMNPASWSFLIWTCANLIPRAFSHHRWYHHHFQDYPKERKALVPYLL